MPQSASGSFLELLLHVTHMIDLPTYLHLPIYYLPIYYPIHILSPLLSRQQVPNTEWFCSACRDRISMRESKHDHQFDNLDKQRSRTAEEDLLSCCVERKVAASSSNNNKNSSSSALEAGMDEVGCSIAAVESIVC